MSRCPISIAGVLGLLAIVTSVQTGCHSVDDGPGPLPEDLSTVALSDELRTSVIEEWQRLAGDVVTAPRERDIRTYFELRRMIQGAETRAAGEDSLFALWEADPEHFLWLEVAHTKRRLLSRDEDRERLWAAAAGGDSTRAVAHFLYARRYWGHRPDATKRFFAAAERQDELDALQRLWLQTRVANIESDEGHHREAVARMLAGLEEARAVGGDPLASTWWFSTSRFLRKAGRLGDALHAARLAMACAVRGGDDYLEIRSRLELGRVREARFEYDASMDIYSRAGGAADSLGFSRWTRNASSSLAVVARAVGDVERELACHDRALTIAVAARDTYAIVMSDLALGHCYRRTDNLAAARDRFRHAQDANARWRRGDQTGYIGWSWALYHYQLGDYAAVDSIWANLLGDPTARLAARDLAEIHLDLIKQSLETGDPDLAYQSIAKVRELGGNLARESAEFDLLLELAVVTARFHAHQGEARLAYDALARAESLNSSFDNREMDWEMVRCRGETALLLGDLEGAEEAYARSLELADDLGLPGLVNRSRIALGHVLLQRGRPDRARNLFRNAAPPQEYWHRFAGLLFQGKAAAHEGDHTRALDRFSAAAAMMSLDGPRDLHARLQLERGRSLIASGRTGEAMASLEEAGRLLRAQGDRVDAELFRAFHRDAHRELAETIIGLLVDFPDLAGPEGAALAALAIAEEVRWRLDPERSAPSPADLAARPITPGSPVAAYFVGQERSFLWNGTAMGWTLSVLPGRAELSARIVGVLTDLEAAGRELAASPALALTQLLLGPVLPAWEEGGVLYLIPDDVLDGLPWAGLPTADPAGGVSRALVTHGPVVELVSWRPVAPERDRGGTDPRRLPLLAVGVDDIAANGDLAALRFAEAEARAVAALWPNGEVDLRLGAGADLLPVTDTALGPYGAIHVATHAVVHQGLPGRSTLRLGGDGHSSPLTIQAVRRLDIDAELVFLSCCEGAKVGRDTGSGLNSFARAFLQAGAHAVLAPSIRVEDEPSRVMAELFYRYWLEGRSRAAALRAAQLEFQEQYPRWRHPHYWAFLRLIQG